MSDNDIPSYEEYAAAPIFKRLTDIRGFNLIAEIPPITAWGDSKFSRAVLDRLYETVRAVVRAAEFYHEDQIRCREEPGGVAVTYEDDVFDFSLLCTGDAIVIKRQGSRLSHFHNWYKAFMPSSSGLLTETASILSELSSRRIDIVRALFDFDFVLYDLKDENTMTPLRNYEIMQKLLKGYLDDNGFLVESPKVASSSGRIDLRLSRWVGDPGARRRLFTSIEAPGNQNYSSMWFEFHYIGETYTAPDTGVREPFIPNQFLTEYTLAYVNFVRDNAINGFLERLMRGAYYKSAAGNLP